MGKTEPKMIRPSNLRGAIEVEEEVLRVNDVLDVDKGVGDEIRNLRKARDTTLTALSALTGLSQGYLSQVERGISSPSIKALHSISRALGVNISWFFRAVEEGEENLKDFVVRADKRRRLHFSSGITDELLSPNLGREIELLRCIFKPGSESGSETYTHRGEEAGVVISGVLHLWLDGDHIVLNEGDSFAFSSGLPHRYSNPTDDTTVVIWAITPPSY
jgi:transcriptional regulator with XRE-family HTH domain